MLLFHHVLLRLEFVRIRIDHHQSRDFGHIPVRKHAHIVPAEGRTRQNVGPANTGIVQRPMQLLGGTHARARHGAGFAESCASAIVAADARPFGDLRLHLRPGRCPVFPAGIENDRGRAAPHAVEVQPKSPRVDELTGPRVNDVRGIAATAGRNDAGHEHNQEQAHSCSAHRSCSSHLNDPPISWWTKPTSRFMGASRHGSGSQLPETVAELMFRPVKGGGDELEGRAQ